MAHVEQREFCEKVKEKFPDHFKNKKVLDIGSLDINGSNKTLFEDCDFVGLDVGEGKNVDVISVGHLYDGPDNHFDTIISTEVFEHDMFYKETVTNIMRMLKPGGLFVFTCASIGRPEHGTRRTGGFDAPLLIQISEEWADYYKNLTEDDFKEITNFNSTFPDSYFEFKNTDIEIPADLYFYGIKGGSKYTIQTTTDENSEDIIVINSWIDTDSKEEKLVNLIKRVKSYGHPILLTGHYPVKPEIQNMVDYYLFDKKNPLLTSDEFNGYGVNSVRWTQIDDVRIENTRKFHHDYAIWETMRVAFKFCKDLGKTNIHFMEYDNLPDEQQFRQSFIEILPHSDAVIYEYHKGSASEDNPYCATYIFSIKTDVAIKTIDKIKTKEEFFKDKPDSWQLEKNFLQSLKSVTSNVRTTQYIPNDNELNLQGVWDDGRTNDVFLEIYLAVDKDENLYLHPISGTGERRSTKDYLLEVVYGDYKKFHMLRKGAHNLHLIGKYSMGSTVSVYYQGVTIFKEFLSDDVKTFRKFNKLTHKDETEIEEMEEYTPDEINMNFIDGPFVEIKDNSTKEYHVEFIDLKESQLIHQTNLKSNHWCKPNIKFSKDWLVKIKGVDNDYHFEHEFNPTGRRILISFESKSLGDTISWIPQVERYRIKKNAYVICSTFHNKLFKDQYPNIEFVEPGANVNDVYSLFRVGVFKKDDRVDLDKHPLDPKTQPLGKICSDILGIDYVEVSPKLPIFGTEKKKRVSIATHATAQCKYWNNPTGWQDVVDHLVSKGYEVKLVSREDDGYMGNGNPKNATRVRSGSLENVIKEIQESELFIGISSGLSWVSWGSGTETIIISGFTDAFLEPTNGVTRIINTNVCNGCWSRHEFDPGDWYWCPDHKDTKRQFECSKQISSAQVIKEIDKILK